MTASIGIAARRTRMRRRNCCATPTSRCTRPSGTDAIATCCSNQGCRLRCRRGWSSRWTCAWRSRTTSSSSSTSRRSTCRGWAHGHGGADALEAAHARHRAAERLHPAAGGDGADSRSRQRGYCARRAGRACAGATPATRSASPSTSPRVSSTLTSSWRRCERTLQDSALDPDSLTIEITETALMRDIEQAADAPRLRQAARRADRDRRLRNRLLLDGAPPAVSRRRAEDRPLVHHAG